MAELPIAPVNTPLDRHAAPIAAVRKALEDLRFGQVLLTLHDGKVVQLDVTERHRFTES